ncbi:von Willebrand factor type A domain protein [Maioricimonas rarisocia]|uniref:von Willebrand factor type A domain protein n=1 Tax=Maioricimonas rarisocia TaxID=2528026 RepID=A0A517Z7W5_9PLAN|nr:VIT domain-containing protein [Maioricimonas rarisocia]QDU38567.1 von Willebrand factor type A domain protein [Maioricimonas rarisocia]
MRRLSPTLPGLLVLLLAGSVSAQGVLVSPSRPVPLPRPVPNPQPTTSTYKISELKVDARLQDQVARVQVSQSFVNTGSSQMEVQFLFPLPYDGAIDRLTLMVDGKEFPAELLPADKARQKYEEIVRRSKDPALLEWMGHGLFQTNVFPVPAGATRTVTLHYNQLLRKSQGLTDFLFPLRTAGYTSAPVEKLQFRLNIESSLPIKNVYSPTHAISIERPGRKQAQIEMTQTNQTPTTDFRLMFDVNPKKLGTSVLSYRPDKDEDGYFVLLTTPQVRDKSHEPMPRTIQFVIDTSGSMTGPKIEQAKQAARFVLNNLREGDLFNIIAYNSDIQKFRPELERFNDKTRTEAIGFVNGLYAGGGTNIHDALTTALSQLQETDRPNYVLFLTDGLPTVGETNEAKIAAAVKQANSVRARMLQFGVGYDVNSRLLDRLARDNFGGSEYVRPDEDIEAHVSRVYSRIADPVLTDVQVSFEYDEPRHEGTPPVNRIYPSGTFDLFAGEQLVLVGRYRTSGQAKVVISGTVGDENESFDFPAKLVESSDDESNAFVAKLWAMRRIGEIIDQLDLFGKNEELVKELVALSTKHGILTPYTSFLADENVRPTELAESEAFRSNAAAAGVELRRLSEVEGRGGVAQRSVKQRLLGRPANSSAPSADAPAPGGGSQFGAIVRDTDTDELVVMETVREVAGQALYKRGKILLTPATADVNVEEEQENVVVVEKYTDAYFQLARENTAAQNQILSSLKSDEELLVKWRGQTYWVK